VNAKRSVTLITRKLWALQLKGVLLKSVMYCVHISK